MSFWTNQRLNAAWRIRQRYVFPPPCHCRRMGTTRGEGKDKWKAWTTEYENPCPFHSHVTEAFSPSFCIRQRYYKNEYLQNSQWHLYKNISARNNYTVAATQRHNNIHSCESGPSHLQLQLLYTKEQHDQNTHKIIKWHSLSKCVSTRLYKAHSFVWKQTLTLVHDTFFLQNHIQSRCRPPPKHRPRRGPHRGEGPFVVVQGPIYV